MGRNRLRPIIRKVDANQPEIVAAFRAIGYSVTSTAAIGHGFGDILVGKFGQNFLFEIKDGSKPPSARKLTGDEEEFASGWRGHYGIITSVEDVIAFDKRQWGAQ